MDLTERYRYSQNITIWGAAQNWQCGFKSALSLRPVKASVIRIFAP